MKKKLALTAAQRSKARFARAAYVIPPTPIDEHEASKLERMIEDTGLTVAAIIRKLISQGLKV